MRKNGFIPFPILTTGRLTLRQISIEDQPSIFALRSDPEINKYLDRQLAHTANDARDFINTINEGINKSNTLYWAISLQDISEFVGIICLFNFSDKNEACEIGYELLKRFQGQGIMQEAVERVIDYAFTTIKISRIEAFVHRDNQRSIGLLEKFLFKKSNQLDEKNPHLICYNLMKSKLTTTPDNEKKS